MKNKQIIIIGLIVFVNMAVTVESSYCNCVENFYTEYSGGPCSPGHWIDKGWRHEYGFRFDCVEWDTTTNPWTCKQLVYIGCVIDHYHMFECDGTSPAKSENIDEDDFQYKSDYGLKSVEDTYFIYSILKKLKESNHFSGFSLDTISDLSGNSAALNEFLFSQNDDFFSAKREKYYYGLKRNYFYSV